MLKKKKITNISTNPKNFLATLYNPSLTLPLLQD